MNQMALDIYNEAPEIFSKRKKNIYIALLKYLEVELLKEKSSSRD